MNVDDSFDAGDHEIKKANMVFNNAKPKKKR